MSQPICITEAALRRYERDFQPDLFEGEVGLLKAQLLLDTRRMLARHYKTCALCSKAHQERTA